MTLQKSNSILEDDTGIPFKYFDHVDWNVNLFGLYVLPVKDFRENLYQKDLKDAYADTDLYKGELPFSLGYHWGIKGSKSNAIHQKMKTEKYSKVVATNMVIANMIGTGIFTAIGYQVVSGAIPDPFTILIIWLVGRDFFIMWSFCLQ